MSVGANDNYRVVIRNGHQVREGDRVICMKTNRELNVFNGDVGTVMGCEVDFENNATLLIQIGKKDVLIDRSYWSNLDLAYAMRSEEHTSELQSLMRISYAVFCLKQKTLKKHKEEN